MSVKIEKTRYSKWGDCIRMSAGGIELYATVDIGPRIIRYAPVGGKNVMFEDINDEINNDLSEYGWFEGDKWHIYGGHRLWTSPEGMPRSYYADNYPVEYDIKGDTIVLKQRVQEFNNVRFTIEVTMDDNGGVTLKHIIENVGPWEIELAPWALTVLAPGGMEVVPQSKRDTGLLGNRVLALWPYTDMSDPRVRWGEKFITLKQDSSAHSAFKFGSSNEEGYAAYFVNGDLFIKRFTHIIGANYPDFGCSFETYTNKHMLEMESLAPLSKIVPGGLAQHTERWVLHKNVEMPHDDDIALEETLKKYL